MPSSRKTRFQVLGELGVSTVVKNCSCPRCKRSRTLKRLIANFKAADIICDFCGYTAQVKAVTVSRRGRLPSRLLGASWLVQLERIESHIYLPLFIVTVWNGVADRVYYVPPDTQVPGMFRPRELLRETAKRAGWQGFVYDLPALPTGIPLTVWTNPSRRGLPRV